MDTLSTAIGGALLAKALPRDRRGPSGVWCVTLASAIPDIDVFADLFTNDPLRDLTQHRAFTHSILGAAVMAPLIALLFWRFSKDKNCGRLVVLALLGLVWHMFTDLATSWGTMVFYPFSRDRAVWDLIFIIDFTFTGILLLPQLTAWIYRAPAAALRRGGLIWAALAAFTGLVITLVSRLLGADFNWGWFALLTGLEASVLLLPAIRGLGFRHDSSAFCRLGVATLAAYVAVCAVAHHRAVRTVEGMAVENRLAPRSLAALPQPLSPFRWSGLALTPEGVYQVWLNVLDSGQTTKFQFFSTDENSYVARARELPGVRTYLWFARFPVARYRQESDRHIVEYSDVRFQMPPGREPSFVFRVVFSLRGEVLSSGFVEP